jgi:putative ABC transport system permease protein
MAVRYSLDDPKAAVKLVESKWKEFSPGEPFEYNFLDENFNALYRSEMKIGKLLTIFSALAILIACLGLFGLAAFTAEQRTREIGIRKAMGASSASIVRLLSSEFIKYVVIAFLFAIVPAWYFIYKWLQNFVYRVDINYIIFLASGLGALIIALFTVSYQSIKAARINPAETLRCE